MYVGDIVSPKNPTKFTKNADGFYTCAMYPDLEIDVQNINGSMYKDTCYNPVAPDLYAEVFKARVKGAKINECARIINRSQARVMQIIYQTLRALYKKQVEKQIQNAYGGKLITDSDD